MDARDWFFVAGVVAVVLVIWWKAGKDDARLFDGVEETKVPRHFGRIDKRKALQRTNAHYE